LIKDFIAYNDLRLGEVAEGLACSVAVIAPNCGYRLPFFRIINNLNNKK
jgi:hypothetical protein